MKIKSLISSLVLVSLPFFAHSQTLINEQDVASLLKHPQRPAADASRDASRRPEKIIPFLDLSKGDHVIDIMAGGGWYTELFARAVGDDGKVYMHNDEVIWRFAKDRAITRTQDNRLSNVTRLDSVAIADMEIPENSIDTIFTALNYHDMFFVSTTDREGNQVKLRDDVVDYMKALTHLKQRMKDDGVLVIIDHNAQPGSGYEATNTLHRIDPDIVKYQLDKAGFKLIEEAYYLRNSEDDLSTNVFESGTRGKTDRFIFKFMKK